MKIRYGNTNTFYIPGLNGGLLFDTDYAGTLPAFYRAIKQERITVKDIAYVMASHYHPDHMGLIGELTGQGVKLLAADVQRDFIHSSDGIFAREKTAYSPIDEALASVISCETSRDFLSGMGIRGEIIRTPSHSEDSISLVLDDGCCFVGDLEPMEHIGAYEDSTALKNDWDRILSFHPKRVFFAHRPEKVLE